MNAQTGQLRKEQLAEEQLNQVNIKEGNLEEGDLNEGDLKEEKLKEEKLKDEKLKEEEQLKKVEKKNTRLSKTRISNNKKSKEDIFEVDLPINAIDYAIGSSQRDQLHHHQSHQLLLSTNSDISLRLRDEKISLPAESACLIPSGVDHALLTQKSCIVHCIYFKAVLPINSYRSVSLSRLIKEMIQELSKEKSSELSKRLLSTCLYDQLANLLWENYQPRTTLSKPLRRACEIIYNHSAIDLSISELAKKVGVSDRTLRRLASTQLNYSLSDFRVRCRMHEACRLLQTDMSVSQVSGQVGYESESAFYNAFRTVVGMTPLQFRKKCIIGVQHQSL